MTGGFFFYTLSLFFHTYLHVVFVFFSRFPQCYSSVRLCAAFPSYTETLPERRTLLEMKTHTVEGKLATWARVPKKPNKKNKNIFNLNHVGGKRLWLWRF